MSDERTARAEQILAQASAEKTDPSLLTAEPAPNGPIPQPVPDHAASQDEPTEAGKPPKARAFSKLGANRKRGSGVRALVTADRDKIVGLYVTCGFAVMMVKPEAAKAIAESAERCADAWVELAKENDAVRRAVLFIIEGGAWGAVIVAHMPIALALVPENVARQYNFLLPAVPDSPDGAEPSQ